MRIIKKKKLNNINFSSTGDTEVFLKLYEKFGISFLKDKNIDSLYSISIYDKKKSKLFISRDWPGRIPLYFYHDENKFVFSSELKAFEVFDDISLLSPIELKPGNILEYCLKKKSYKIIGEYNLKPYFSKTNDNDILKLGKQLDNVLDDSAKNRTMGDVPICTMLSGGIDSVLTTFYVLKNINFKKTSFEPTSFVFRVKGFDSIDVKTAIEASKGFSEIGHKLKIIEADKEQIVHDLVQIVRSFEMRKLKALSFYPLPIYWYLAPAMRREGFKVTIGGHGVDELLGAYTSWKELKVDHKVQVKLISRKAFINNIYDNMLKRASIIFMNRGPIEARFPFLNHKVCEFMLGIDQKWLSLNNQNAEIMLKLIDNSKEKKSLENIYNLLLNYLNDKEKFLTETPDDQKFDLEKIFWKFPLIVSSYFASKSSFLKFKDVFRPKIRGQHGAGITNLEDDIIKSYSKYGKDDKEVFKNISSKIFN